MVLTCTHNICFEQKYENSQRISTENFHFYSSEKSLYIACACFRNVNSEFTLLLRGHLLSRPRIYRDMVGAVREKISSSLYTDSTSAGGTEPVL